jgi:ArsR family transcriptional regulator, arsenate/arsenite/antimonite-responsive transcriptional repressor
MRESQLVKIAKALADPTRLKMLGEIRVAGELTCSQVCERFTQRQPTISHHIRTLEAAGLITIRRAGQFHVLTVNAEALAEFAESVSPREEGIAAKARKPRPVAAGVREPE